MKNLLRNYQAFTKDLRSKRRGTAFVYFRPTDRPEASVANSTRGGGTLQDFIYLDFRSILGPRNLLIQGGGEDGEHQPGRNVRAK